MKIFQIIFYKSKNRYIVLSSSDTLAGAKEFIKNYEGVHKKANMVIREKTVIKNPYKILKRKSA